MVVLTIFTMQTTFAEGEQITLAKDSLLRKDPLRVVISSYFTLTNALSDDDEKTAAIAANQILLSITRVSSDKLSKSQKAVWIKYMDKLSYDAGRIKSATNIDQQREYFMSLSKNMFEVVKSFKTNTNDLYYQYCPMANDGKGAYWVTDIQKISNPYFGKQMAGCGSTKETINANK